MLERTSCTARQDDSPGRSADSPGTEGGNPGRYLPTALAALPGDPGAPLGWQVTYLNPWIWHFIAEVIKGWSNNREFWRLLL